MWRCVVYMRFCHVLVVFVIGGWNSNCSDTRSLFTWQMSQYAASVAKPYLWDFIHLDLDEWILEVGEMLLSEEPPPWLGILAKSSLMSECEESVCMRWRVHVCSNKSWILLPPLTLLDSPVAEGEITWLIMCIWKETQSFCCGGVLFMCVFAMF